MVYFKLWKATHHCTNERDQPHRANVLQYFILSEWELLLCTIEDRNKCYRNYKYTLAPKWLCSVRAVSCPADDCLLLKSPPLCSTRWVPVQYKSTGKWCILNTQCADWLPHTLWLTKKWSVCWRRERMDGCLCCQANMWTILRCLLSQRWREESGVRSRRKMRSRHGTLGATQRLLLKPQPVHGTAHSVVVG